MDQVVNRERKWADTTCLLAVGKEHSQREFNMIYVSKSKLIKTTK